MALKVVSPSEASRLREESKTRTRNRICGIMRQAVPKLMSQKPPQNQAELAVYYANVGDIWGEAIYSILEIDKEEEARLRRETSRIEGAI